MEEYNLGQTIDILSGSSREQLTTQNQWAAVALNRYHDNSNAIVEFSIDGLIQKAKLSWNSDFPKSTMKEKKDMANHGGVAMAWFVMSVLQDYRFVEQTEIGSGVDYWFLKEEPNDEDLNFIIDSHYVEVSGLLEESKTNTLVQRISKKHKQIGKGTRSNSQSSVLITLFSQPKVVKEVHL